MRCANRNKQTFWYALHDHLVEDYDEYGNQIGTSAEYGNPTQAKGNISPAKGEVVSRQFGDDDLYDRVIVMENRDTPIDEYAILWIDVEPELDEDGALAVGANGDVITPHNYIVRKVARGLPTFGGVQIAVDKVSVT